MRSSSALLAVPLALGVLAAGPLRAQPADSVAAAVAALRPAPPAPRPPLVARTPPADDERTFRPRRFYAGVGATVAADAVVMAGLAGLWYTGDRVPFHWYADAPPEDAIPDDGWLDDWHTYVQMDKGGHALTAWGIARAYGAYGTWSGLSDRQAGLFGATVATLFQSQIELFDGFDPAYGASRTDLVANVVGAAVGGAQVAFPGRSDAVTFKVSYHPSPYYDRTVSSVAPARFVGNAIKDYDGLSYWAVARPSRLGAPAWWPRWLGVAVGYGGDGLEHPVSGLTTGGGEGGPVHRRQVYLGLDLDFLEAERRRLPRALRPVAAVLSIVRLPFPALELGGGGVRWHGLYY